MCLFAVCQTLTEQLHVMVTLLPKRINLGPERELDDVRGRRWHSLVVESQALSNAWKLWLRLHNSRNGPGVLGLERRLILFNFLCTFWPPGMVLERYMLTDNLVS